MLKRLRWKFIALAVGSVAIVLVILVLGINLSFRHVTVRGMDHMLTLIAQNNGQVPQAPPPTGGVGFEYSQETPFDTRFFVLWEGSDAEITRTQLDYIASVTGKDAEGFLRQAEKSDKTFGYVDRYRFYRCTDYENTLFVFLDCSRQRHGMQTLLLVSLLVAFLAMCATFLLAFLLSPRAIRSTVRSVEKQKQFITDASHEMKTPLTVIRTYADLLCLEDGENEWASGIVKESRRLSGLVSDLVLLSRWDEESPLAEKQRFDLSQALWDTVAPYQNLARARGLTLNTAISEDLFCVGDEGSLQTALSTLLDNAVKYSTEGGTITLEAAHKGRSIVVDLSNPCDLPQDLELDRLFDRFYRADPSRTRDSGGSGVGLSIARAIVEAHGGTIRAVSPAEGMICFRVSLPG